MSWKRFRSVSLVSSQEQHHIGIMDQDIDFQANTRAQKAFDEMVLTSQRGKRLWHQDYVDAVTPAKRRFQSFQGPGSFQNEIPGRSRISRAVRRLLSMRSGGYYGEELKFLDCYWSNVNLPFTNDASSCEIQPTTGCTQAISVPAQGDTGSERVGRQYLIRSAMVSGSVHYTSDGDLPDPYQNNGCFAALVLDTQANGATIVSENVYTNAGGSGAQVMPRPLRNLAYSKRYRILDSKYIPPTNMYAFNDSATTGSIGSQTSSPFTLSWKGKILCNCSGTTANVSSVTDNAIHLLVFNAGGLNKSFYGKSRVRFVG